MNQESKTSIIAQEKRWITFELSDAEILAKASQASTLNSKIKDLEHKKKESAENFKGQIDGAKSELSNTFSTISSRSERREVDCLAEYDYALKKVFYSVNNQVMEETQMSEYDFTNRPADILPEEKKEDEVRIGDGTEATEEAFFEDAPDADAPKEKLTSKEAINLQDDVNAMMVG